MSTKVTKAKKIKKLLKRQKKFFLQRIAGKNVKIQQQETIP